MAWYYILLIGFIVLSIIGIVISIIKAPLIDDVEDEIYVEFLKRKDED